MIASCHFYLGVPPGGEENGGEGRGRQGEGGEERRGDKRQEEERRGEERSNIPPPSHCSFFEVIDPSAWDNSLCCRIKFAFCLTTSGKSTCE